MIGLEIQFLTGRYHATPWNRHPNEGDTAWPPPPWQLLRALVATWYLKAPELDAAQVRDLILTLASRLPLYRLPPTSAGHTRHYVPLDKPGQTTRMIDAFLSIDRSDRLLVAWPDLSLTETQRATFKTLAERVAYLGRAESWASLSVRDLDPSTPWNAAPCDDATLEPAAASLIPVLAPLSPDAFSHWRQGVLVGRQQQKRSDKAAKARLAGKTSDNVKLSASELQKLEEDLPSNLFDALHADSSDTRKAGWSLTPGAQWVRYAHTPARSPLPAAAVDGAPPPTVARYALSSPVLPSLHKALFIGDRVHRALVKRLEDVLAGPLADLSADDKAHARRVVTGMDAGRQPLRDEDHAHFYILPESHSRREQLTHLTLYARGGITLPVRLALERLSLLHRRDADVQMTLLGIGDPSHLGGLSPAEGQCALLAEARVWESQTPFVATRHTKPPRRDAHGDVIGSPRHDLRRLLSAWLARYAPSITVEIEPMTPARQLHWHRFYTSRDGERGARGRSAPQGFRLVFSQPVRGPLAFGYGAHLGLGTFQAVA